MVATLAGLIIGIAAAAILPVQTIARAAASEPDVPFAAKGDRLGRCTAAAWPDFSASCLTRADGSPAPEVRMITIGYQSGDNTTILLRLPAADEE